jgi:hypothetical protein
MHLTTFLMIVVEIMALKWFYISCWLSICRVLKRVFLFHIHENRTNMFQAGNDKLFWTFPTKKYVLHIPQTGLHTFTIIYEVEYKNLKRLIILLILKIKYCSLQFYILSGNNKHPNLYHLLIFLRPGSRSLSVAKVMWIIITRPKLIRLRQSLKHHTQHQKSLRYENDRSVLLYPFSYALNTCGYIGLPWWCCICEVPLTQ